MISIGLTVAAVALLASAFIMLGETVNKKDKSKLYLFCCYTVGTLVTILGTIILIKALGGIISVI